MAERKMFSKTVTTSARFLTMPATARLLYYDLGMAADDDGVVEALPVIRMTGNTKRSLKVLEENGYVRILDSNSVAYINDWKRNNLIKKDRYQPSIYKGLLEKIESSMEPKWNPSGTQMEPQDRLGEDRLGEDRLGEDRLGEDRGGEESPAPHPPHRARKRDFGLGGAKPEIYR